MSLEISLIALLTGQDNYKQWADNIQAAALRKGATSSWLAKVKNLP